MNYPRVFVAAISLFHASCSTSSITERECEVHHRPLLKEKGFTFAPSVTVSMSYEWHKAHDDLKLPHTSSYGFSQEKSELFTVPMTWIYCPECDAEFNLYVKKLYAETSDK